jgi:hypothetical protein
MSNLSDDLFAAMEKAVQRWAQITLGQAVKNAPVDEGTLRDSALAVVGKTSDTVRASLSFNTEYAAYQHEGVGFNHPKGGDAKYLERAIKETTPKFKPELQKQVDAVMARYRID